MEYSIKNKNIAITGAAGGIGYAIADKYLNEGAKIIILLDIDETNGTEAAKKLNGVYGVDRAVYIKCNVTTDLESVFETIVNKYKRIDVLVNSAGINDQSEPRRMIDIHATSLVEWSLKFYDHMKIDNSGIGGTIVNISSIYGLRITPFFPVYHMTKFAVQGFTRSLGHEYNFRKSHVRVVALCPGFTDTNFNKALKMDSKNESVTEDMIECARSHVWQETEDVGKAAVEVFKRTKSGSTWLIEGGQPISEIHNHE